MPTNAPLSKPIHGSLRRCRVLLLAGLLTGCSMAPTYQAPALPVPVSQDAPRVTDTPSPASGLSTTLSDDERQMLASLDPAPELPRLVALALDFNRDLRLAMLRVEQARTQYGMTRSDRLPTVTLGVQRDRQQFQDKATNERYGQALAVASLGISDFELDFFGRVRSLSDAARHDYLASRYGAEAARNALIIEVARLFLQERLQAGLLTDAQVVADSQRQRLALLARQQLDGAVSQEAVESLRMNSQRATGKLQDAIADHERALNALSWVTGYQATLAMPALHSAVIDLATPPWLANLPSQRLLQRFDVRQCEEALRAADANIGAARAAFFPSITLSTGAGIASPKLSTLFSSGSGAWLFTPQLNLPIFDAGRHQANLDLAKVRQQMAVAQYEKTVQDAFREMADLLAQRQQTLVNANTQGDLNSLAMAQALRLDQQIAAGAAARAQLPLSNIRLAEADAQTRTAAYDLLFNRLALYRALSGAPLFSSTERVSP